MVVGWSLSRDVVCVDVGDVFLHLHQLETWAGRKMGEWNHWNGLHLGKFGAKGGLKGR